MGYWGSVGGFLGPDLGSLEQVLVAGVNVEVLGSTLGCWAGFGGIGSDFGVTGTGLGLQSSMLRYWGQHWGTGADFRVTGMDLGVTGTSLGL